MHSLLFHKTPTNRDENFQLQLIATVIFHVIFQVENIRAILKKELDLALVDIADPKAKLEGGDVLFTGKEFFVGISDFTNEAGARAVANAFPEFPCVPIKVSLIEILVIIFLVFFLLLIDHLNDTFLCFELLRIFFFLLLETFFCPLV